MTNDPGLWVRGSFYVLSPEIRNDKFLETMLAWRRDIKPLLISQANPC